MMKMGYWATHEYSRHSVADDVEEFCGWQRLIEIVSRGGSQRNNSFLATLFLSGGRVSEVLQLSDDMFDHRPEENVVIVRGMTMLKRFRKIDEKVDEDGKLRWVTEPIISYRRPFPILLQEPLTPIMLRWVESSNGLLFPSPYRDGPLSRSWAYKLVRRVGEDLGMEHLRPHWFRSQRACQLVSDYGFEVLDLVDFFRWRKSDTALTYARRGWRGLVSKMKPIRYV